MTLMLMPACSAQQVRKTTGVTMDLGPCRSSTVWSTALYALAERAAADISRIYSGVTPEVSKAVAGQVRATMFWWMVRSLLIEGRYHNAAALRLKGLKRADGGELWLFRSGYTGAPRSPGSCFHHLVNKLGVRHVVNLYDGPMYREDLDRGEAGLVAQHGGDYVLSPAHWRGEMRRAWKRWKANPLEGHRIAYQSARARAHRQVATQIKALLRPGGKPPTGHLHVHCGGGMHRTSMFVGVVERCINGRTTADVSHDYRAHVGWTDAKHPGGFEAQNIDFIASFPCELLRKTP